MEGEWFVSNDLDGLLADMLQVYKLRVNSTGSLPAKMLRPQLY